ncbi:very-short-patch-repair endonuclease [Sphingobium fontiphilum]|uniref:Very-short-patch-repair endonuclease n=1 Tax=Sphingobium fontiphilum TaxID=944425 RepID=A0A7W6DLV2_9SPHN|nr:endonuclease domain-containing protein [Sphingobium fontiphilum]MBB3983007.1 very-short-patch-repair endonuclease [Sphingobium fontiphilum]
MARATTPRTVAKARTLRQNLSLPEALLWRLLKGQPQGIKFRRQHPVGPYILDFYVSSAKLGIEIDGETHDRGDRPHRDATRDHWLAEQNLRIIRISAADVLKDPTAVADGLIALAQAASADAEGYRGAGAETAKRP